MIYQLIIFGFLGGAWAYALTNNKFIEKVKTRRYKFSFPRFCFLLKDLAAKITKDYRKQVIISLLFIIIPICLLMKSIYPLIFSLIGNIVFQYITARKKN